MTKNCIRPEPAVLHLVLDAIPPKTKASQGQSVSVIRIKFIDMTELLQKERMGIVMECERSVITNTPTRLLSLWS